MEKIAIIGAPGAGKTTLARNLHRILNIKVRHLDRLFWQSGWQSGAGRTTLANLLSRLLNIKVYHLDLLFWNSSWQSIDGPTRIDTMQDIIREKQWIIEGTYLYSSEPRLSEADTIIFLDIPVPMCLLRVIKRHRRDRGRFRRDIPEGCIDKLTPHRMLKLLVFPIQDRKKLKQKLLNYKSHQSKEIIWLRSNKEVEDFLAQLEQKANTTQAISPVKERGLVTAKS